MCRQETTVRFWGWKAVKDKHQATELRPVSAGQHHLQLCSLHQVQEAWVDVGRGGAHNRRHKMQTASLVMQDLLALLPSADASNCRRILDTYPSTS